MERSMTDSPDTRKSSAITDHPFEPRTMARWTMVDPLTRFAREHGGDRLRVQPNPYLCGYRGCGLAEAAHAETTVQR